MNKVLLFILLCCSLLACNFFTKKKTIAGPDEKQQMSVEKGMKNAFLEYIDSNGVLLRPNQLPVLGADAIDFLIQENDSSYTLQWEPKNGMLAESGELGYTYGLYKLQPKNKDTAIFGTYVSIWKKQSDGSWKFVLDSGNEGVGDGSGEAQ
jgi:ketosteroid isomerase-like protein